MVANPTDLVKVRLQAEGKLPPGVPRRYSGSLNAYSTIIKQVLLLSVLLVYLFVCHKS
jgi:solute carrier family 25 (mitochondrial uncoupling protein), member 8/9